MKAIEIVKPGEPDVLVPCTRPSPEPKAGEVLIRVTAAGNKLVVEIAPGSGEIRDQIVAAAVQGGMGVLEFSAEKLSLEEIFLQLTTEEAHA
jgi:hypothetical protein